MNPSFKQSWPVRGSVWLLNFAISQWFLVLLGVFVALAHSYPEFAKQGGTIKAQYSIQYGAVAVIFLVSGLSMSTKDLMVNMSHWRAHFTVLSMSFLVTSAIIYGIASGIKSAHDGEIDEWLLVGMIVTHACPTTVSSNVVMTKQAHGNDILTLCEVFIGNLLGAFITPALVQMYLRGTWAFGNPTNQGSGSSETIQQLYAEVMKQLGLSVFVPIFVGQVVQNVFPKQTKWTLQTFYLNKVGSFMLLLIMFQSFSTAFAQKAFQSVSHASIIFIVFFNIGIYLFFTVLCFLWSRPYFIKVLFSEEPTPQHSRLYRFGYKFLTPFYYSRKDTVSVMLCGPAKTAALGVSLVSSQYGSHSPNLGKLLVPLVLYQAEQVMTAQILVNLMRKWIHAEDKPEDEESEQLEQEQEGPTTDNNSPGKKSHDSTSQDSR
ncbi:putative membrane protein [Meyerozyma sp. JA9]|nr:putative membrane protein [Meyerozyma sp. JA9]